MSTSGHGVRGEGEIGVFGTSSTDHGVHGQAAGDNAGVLGRNSDGHGVRGEGKIGVVGRSSTNEFAAVYGQHLGLGPGVVGDAAGQDEAGFLGRNSTMVSGGRAKAASSAWELGRTNKRQACSADPTSAKVSGVRGAPASSASTGGAARPG